MYCRCICVCVHVCALYSFSHAVIVIILLQGLIKKTRMVMGQNPGTLHQKIAGEWMVISSVIW